MSATFEAARRHAARAPSSKALSTSTGATSYAELLERVTELGETLREEGVRTVALAADNSRDWILADLAASFAGITVVPVPAFFSPRQLRHVLDSSGADAVIVDAAADTRAFALAAAPRSLTAALHLVPLERRDAGRPTPDGTAKISYTSGTTGEPKGVCLSMAAMEAVAASIAEATRALDIERHLCLLPLSTLLENVAGVYAPLLRGAEILVPALRETGLDGAARFDAGRLLECLRDYRPHSIIVVPQLLDALVAAFEARAKHLPSLRFVAVGGAHTPVALLERADRIGLPVYEGYGLTECASVVAMNTPEARRAGSAGRALPHARVRIDAGEIVVSGALLSGYVGERVSIGAEFRTGDVGVMDAEGFIHVRGRRRNVFITSFGRNVSPEWVEAELTRSQAIAQAALFGEARPWNVAVVVPAAGAGDDEVRAGIDAVNASLPDYARVGQWLTAAEPFSAQNRLLTVNGRLRRDAIWRLYRERVNRCYEDCTSEAARAEERA